MKINKTPSWLKLQHNINSNYRRYGRGTWGYEYIRIYRDGKYLPAPVHYNKDAEKGYWITSKGLKEVLIKWRKHLRVGDLLAVDEFADRGRIGINDKCRKAYSDVTMSADHSFWVMVANYLPYEKAKEWVRKNLTPIGIDTHHKFKEYVSANDLPHYIPKNPYWVYNNYLFIKGKMTWKDFLGQKQ